MNTRTQLSNTITKGEPSVVKPDFHFQNHGSICLLQPVSEACKEWVEENVGDENTMTWGGALVVEPRYVEDILNGLAEAGFSR